MNSLLPLPGDDWTKLLP